MKKKLSQRPLNRFVMVQAELGPWFTSTVQGKDNTQRPSQKFVIWSSDLPTRKLSRWTVVLQQLNRPASWSDKIHNPIIYRKTVVRPGEGNTKVAFIQVKQVLYRAIKAALLTATRPQLGYSIDYCGVPWATHEPGFATDTLGVWRERVLEQFRQALCIPPTD